MTTIVSLFRQNPSLLHNELVVNESLRALCSRRRRPHDDCDDKEDCRFCNDASTDDELSLSSSSSLLSDLISLFIDMIRSKKNEKVLETETLLRRRQLIVTLFAEYLNTVTISYIDSIQRRDVFEIVFESLIQDCIIPSLLSSESSPCRPFDSGITTMMRDGTTVLLRCLLLDVTTPTTNVVLSPLRITEEHDMTNVLLFIRRALRFFSGDAVVVTNVFTMLLLARQDVVMSSSLLSSDDDDDDDDDDDGDIISLAFRSMRKHSRNNNVLTICLKAVNVFWNDDETSEVSAQTNDASFVFEMMKEAFVTDEFLNWGYLYFETIMTQTCWGKRFLNDVGFWEWFMTMTTTDTNDDCCGDDHDEYDTQLKPLHNPLKNNKDADDDEMKVTKTTKELLWDVITRRYDNKTRCVIPTKDNDDSNTHYSAISSSSSSQQDQNERKIIQTMRDFDLLPKNYEHCNDWFDRISQEWDEQNKEAVETHRQGMLNLERHLYTLPDADAATTVHTPEWKVTKQGGTIHHGRRRQRQRQSSMSLSSIDGREDKNDDTGVVPGTKDGYVVDKTFAISPQKWVTGGVPTKIDAHHPQQHTSHFQNADNQNYSAPTKTTTTREIRRELFKERDKSHLCIPPSLMTSFPDLVGTSMDKTSSPMKTKNITVINVNCRLTRRDLSS